MTDNKRKHVDDSMAALAFLQQHESEALTSTIQDVVPKNATVKDIRSYIYDDHSQNANLVKPWWGKLTVETGERIKKKLKLISPEDVLRQKQIVCIGRRAS